MREREGKDRRYSARAPDNGGPHAHAPRPPHPPTRHRITLPHPARPHAAPRARSSSAVRACARPPQPQAAPDPRAGAPLRGGRRKGGKWSRGRRWRETGSTRPVPPAGPAHIPCSRAQQQAAGGGEGPTGKVARGPGDSDARARAERAS